MSTSATQQLAFRLARKPSVLGEIGVRLAFTVVWNAFFGAFIVGAWMHDPRKTPVLIWVVLGALALFGLGMVWDVVARLARLLLGRVPSVEVDRQPLRPGDRFRLRVLEPHPESLAVLQVGLVSVVVASTTRRVTVTAKPTYGTRQVLLDLKGDDIPGDEPLDRTFDLELPSADQVPEDTVRWEILVATVLRQGGNLVCTFPLAVSRWGTHM